MSLRWYGVKCILEHHGLNDDPASHVYEERVIVVRAASFDEAIAEAELNALEYAKGIDATYLQYSNAFSLDADIETLGHGTEVYSLTRETPLGPRELVGRYHDDGTDRGH